MLQAKQRGEVVTYCCAGTLLLMVIQPAINGERNRL